MRESANAKSDDAWWRPYAVHDDDKVRAARYKQETVFAIMNQSPLSHNQIRNKQQHKNSSKNDNDSQHPAPSNKRTEEIYFFQMRKMDQR